jgi:hypothetical protein
MQYELMRVQPHTDAPVDNKFSLTLAVNIQRLRAKQDRQSHRVGKPFDALAKALLKNGAAALDAPAGAWRKSDTNQTQQQQQQQ